MMESIWLILSYPFQKGYTLRGLNTPHNTMQTLLSWIVAEKITVPTKKVLTDELNELFGSLADKKTFTTLTYLQFAFMFSCKL